MTAGPGAAPPVDRVLRAALATQDRVAMGGALRTSVFLVARVDPGTGPAVALAVGKDGHRLLPAFSGLDALAAWGGPAGYAAVTGQGLLDLARAQGVEAVLFDPAGPAAAEIGTRLLQELRDGLVPGWPGPARTLDDLRGRPVTDPSPVLLTAVREAVDPGGPAVWLFEREVAGRAVLSLGVAGDDGAEALARALSARSGLPDVDVLALAPEQAQALAGQLPGGPVTGTQPAAAPPPG